jgi:hypothetical protein
MAVILSKYKESQTGKEKYCVSVNSDIRCKGMALDKATDLAIKLSVGGKYVDNTACDCKVSGRIACVPVAKKEKPVKKELDPTQVAYRETPKKHGKDK